MKLLAICLGHNLAEFEIHGIANVQTKTVKFEGRVNGAAFCESKDYEEVRQEVVEYALANQKTVNEGH